MIGWALSVVLVLLVPIACSNDNGSTVGDAQPAPGVSTFKPGGFDDLPRYRGSRDAGTRSEDGNVVSQSFFVDGADPELIIEFYRSELSGWEFAGEHDEGDALTAEFTEPGDGGRRLEVSATSVDNAPDDTTAQYSLVLHS